MISKQPYFAQRLLEEKNRSDLTGRPFSIILVSVDKIGLNTEEGVFFFRALKNFFKSMRISDHWGWCSRNKLGLILPDTEGEKAQNVIARLKDYLLGMNKYRFNEITFQDGFFSVIEYPKMVRENIVQEIVQQTNNDGAPQQTSFPLVNPEHGLFSKLMNMGKRCIHPILTLFNQPDQVLNFKFYSKPYLKKKIIEEKLRACRLGTHFSLLMFNPFKLICGESKEDRKFIEAIVKILDQETNETIIKGWWDRKTISLLLLDTLPDDAFALVGKITNKIQSMGYRIVEIPDIESFKVFEFQGAKRIEGEAPKGPLDERNSTCQNLPMERVYRDLSILHNLEPHHTLLKRILDILVSVTVLIFFSPVFLVCAILIKLDSPGPIFYRQPRIGKGGRHFTFLKFRTMDYKSDDKIHRQHIRDLMKGEVGLTTTGHSGEKTYKLINDERVTRFGRFLRRYSIDELPQIVNVLKGEMTLVGPRPHPVYEVELYNPWHCYRLNLTPGVTGLAQVYGRYNTNYEDVYRLDIQYCKNPSLILDLKILFKTIFVVFSKRSSD